MRRSLGTYLVAVLPLVAMAILSTYVFAQKTTKDYADETRAMKLRVEQMQQRVGLMTRDITQRPDASAAYYRQLGDINDALVDMADQLNTLYASTQKMLENRALEGDSAVMNDLIGVRQQLEHSARDLENTLQYLEHLSYQLGRMAPSS
jgi:hypothetical protein